MTGGGNDWTEVGGGESEQGGKWETKDGWGNQLYGEKKKKKNRPRILNRAIGRQEQRRKGNSGWRVKSFF